MLRAILSITLLLSICQNACAWGQKGHDIISYIAECHLTQKSRVAVDRLLAGYSIVYWSSWADSSRYTDEYKHTAPWHYRNVERGKTPEQTPTPEEGDVVWAVEEMARRLQDSTLSDEEHAVVLKFLVHFVGDLHCPMHAGRKSDLGGNRVPMVFFWESTNLHAIWDSKLIDRTHAWGYTEWAEQIDRVTEVYEAEIVAGSAKDWFESSFEIATMAYEDAKRNTEVSYDYIERYQQLLERQLRDGGLRLAYILNSIYDR